MKLSTRALYSLRLMIYLADHSDRETPIKLKDIAKAQKLPFKYLEQLVVPLKNAGLITSIQGKQGGYILAHDKHEIKALDVVEASIGSIELLKCVDADTGCKLKDECASRRMWGLITVRITDVLSEYSLEDLSEKRILEGFGAAAEDDDIVIKCT
ncbi:MAG: Rrf2 family transcriptional regulator [bacterium]